MGEQSPSGYGGRLTSLLVLGQRVWKVALDPGVLTWLDPQVSPHKGREHHFVPTSEIIAVEETIIDEKQSYRRKWQKVTKPHAFTVHYVKRAQRHCWRCKEVTFQSTDEQLCNQWIHALKEVLDLQTSRPKHLLVYINPYGGKRQGKRIYEQKVAPLFSLASITTDVVVTEHANHAKENLLEANLEKYDGYLTADDKAVNWIR